MSTPAELEAQLDADPDDRDAYAVLGDVLTRAGDPRGELIALQLAAQAAPSGAVERKLRAAAEAHFAAHAPALLGPLAPIAGRLTWRSGFIQRVELPAGPRIDVVAALRALFAHPSARFVAELRLVIDDEVTATAVLELLARERSRALRELTLTARGKRVPSTLLDPRGAVELGGALAQMPRLDRLAVTAPAIELGEATPMPPLRNLRLAAATLTATCMRAVASAAWPQLARLELRFGTRDDAPATFADLRPLLVRTDLPALTHLRLRNAPFAGGILRELLTAPLTRQLQVLDLSYGSMSPADAAALLRDPTPLAHLRELRLPMRLLREIDRSALAALGGQVFDDKHGPRDETEAILDLR